MPLRIFRPVGARAVWPGDAGSKGALDEARAPSGIAAMSKSVALLTYGLLARLLAGASGTMQKAIDYDGFFILSAVASIAAIVLIPVIVRIRARQADERVVTPESVFGA